MKKNTFRPTLFSLSFCSLLFPYLASAEESESEPESPPWYKRIAIHGFADTYYSFNFNRPADGANFIPGVGTTGKRANEFSLNLGVLELNLDPEPLGVRLVLNYGTGTEVLHAAELEGPGVNPHVWRLLQEASLTYKIPVGNGLLVTGGIYPCHIGFEVFASKDNWNYTRSWLSDLVPFYQAGIRISYPFTKHFSAQLHLVNGWQVIADNNEAKTLGAQLLWNSDRLMVSVNALAGPELPGDNTHWRVLGDAFLVGKPTSWLNLALAFDVGYQQAADDNPQNDAIWYAGEAYLQLTPMKRLSFAIRGGVFHDPQNGISGTAQTLAEGTGTIELRPYDGISVKLEGRYDKSTAEVFTTSSRREDGSIIKTTEQTTLFIGGVASF